MSGVRVEPAEGVDVTVLTMDRPPVNALDLPAVLGLVDRLPALAAEARPLVLTGAGRAFSAGLDLRALATYDEVQRTELFEAIEALAMGLHRLPRPVVAAVNGHAMAGGLLLTLCSDLRIATADPTAKFGLPAVRAGVPYPPGIVDVLKQELSGPAARRLLLGGWTIGSSEALALGLVDERVPTEEVLPRAVAVAAELGALPTAGYRSAKRSLRGGTA